MILKAKSITKEVTVVVVDELWIGHECIEFVEFLKQIGVLLVIRQLTLPGLMEYPESYKKLIVSIQNLRPSPNIMSQFNIDN